MAAPIAAAATWMRRAPPTASNNGTRAQITATLVFSSFRYACTRATQRLVAVQRASGAMNRLAPAVGLPIDDPTSTGRSRHGDSLGDRTGAGPFGGGKRPGPGRAPASAGGTLPGGLPGQEDGPLLREGQVRRRRRGGRDRTRRLVRRGRASDRREDDLNPHAAAGLAPAQQGLPGGGVLPRDQGERRGRRAAARGRPPCDGHGQPPRRAPPGGAERAPARRQAAAPAGHARPARLRHPRPAAVRDEVVRRAKRYLRRRLDRRRPARPAVVLDIDDTSLSLYSCMKRYNFASRAGALRACGRPAGDPPDALVLPLRTETPRGRLFRRWPPRVVSRRYGGQPPRGRVPGSLEARAEAGQRLREPLCGPLQRGARRRIARQRYRILVNLGDQWSDLRGGYAARAYKLPNPMYVNP